MEKKKIISSIALSIMLFTVHATSHAKKIKVLTQQANGTTAFWDAIKEQIILLEDPNNEINVTQALQNLRYITQRKINEWNDQHPQFAIVCAKAPCLSSAHPADIQLLATIVRALEQKTLEGRIKAQQMLNEFYMKQLEKN